MPNHRADALPDLIEQGSRESFTDGDPQRWVGARGGTATQIPAVAAMWAGVPPLSSFDHVRGDPQAEHVLIEYGDYQCPYCAAAEPIIIEVLRRHSRGLMQAFRHFPLSALLGLSVTRLREALSSRACSGKVRRDFAIGLNSGVKGTPTFFIDGELYEGPVTADAMVDALHRADGRVAGSIKISTRT